MAYYRLYCMSESGRFFHCEEIDAADDLEAIEKALELQIGTAAELWQQQRKVHTFEAPVY